MVVSREGVMDLQATGKSVGGKKSTDTFSGESELPTDVDAVRKRCRAMGSELYRIMKQTGLEQTLLLKWMKEQVKEEMLMEKDTRIYISRAYFDPRGNARWLVKWKLNGKTLKTMEIRINKLISLLIEEGHKLDLEAVVEENYKYLGGKLEKKLKEYRSKIDEDWWRLDGIIRYQIKQNIKNIRDILEIMSNTLERYSNEDGLEQARGQEEDVAECHFCDLPAEYYIKTASKELHLCRQHFEKIEEHVYKDEPRTFPRKCYFPGCEHDSFIVVKDLKTGEEKTSCRLHLDLLKYTKRFLLDDLMYRALNKIKGGPQVRGTCPRCGTVLTDRHETCNCDQE